MQVTSLLFGQRAMNVAVRPQINEEVNYKLLAQDLQNKLETLQNNKGKEISDLIIRNEAITVQTMGISEELDVCKKMLSDSLYEQDKLATSFRKATDKNNELAAALKKSEERIKQLDSIITIITVSSGAMSSNKSALDSMDYASPAVDMSEVQQFVLNEREMMKKNIEELQEKNKQLSNKIECYDANEKNMSDMVALLTLESEKQSKVANEYKLQLKMSLDQASKTMNDMERIDTVVKELQNNGLVNLMPQKSQKLDVSASLIFVQDSNDNRTISVPVVEQAFLELLTQVTEREKMIEMLVNQLRMLDLELTSKSLVLNSALLKQQKPELSPPPTLQGSPLEGQSSMNWKKGVKRYQRWNEIAQTIQILQETLPTDSPFYIQRSKLQPSSLPFYSTSDSKITQEYDQFHEFDETSRDLFTEQVRKLNQRYKELEQYIARLVDQIMNQEYNQNDLESLQAQLKLLKQTKQKDIKQLESQHDKLASELQQAKRIIAKLDAKAKQAFEESSENQLKIAALNVANKELENANKQMHQQLLYQGLLSSIPKNESLSMDKQDNLLQSLSDENLNTLKRSVTTIQHLLGTNRSVAPLKRFLAAKAPIESEDIALDVPSLSSSSPKHTNMPNKSPLHVSFSPKVTVYEHFNDSEVLAEQISAIENDMTTPVELVEDGNIFLDFSMETKPNEPHKADKTESKYNAHQGKANRLAEPKKDAPIKQNQKQIQEQELDPLNIGKYQIDSQNKVLGAYMGGSTPVISPQKQTSLKNLRKK